MTRFSRKPRYNLKVILRETGIKADRLRAWEKRYGLPLPQRSKGGHRLYSEFDLETVRWLITRQEEGMRISQAVNLWKSESQGNSNPLEYGSQGTVAEEFDDGQISEIRNNWIDACLEFNENLAEQELSRAFDLYTADRVCIEVLGEGLKQIGESWYLNKVSVQQEHFASHIAYQRLNVLIGSTVEPWRHEKLLVSCAPGEMHTFSALLVTFLLKSAGWEVTYICSDFPLDKFSNILDSTESDLVLMVALQLQTAANLISVSDHILQKGLKFAYGGEVFVKYPNIQKMISGQFLGEQISQSANYMDTLLRQRKLPHNAKPSQYVELAKMYSAKQDAIMADVISKLKEEEGWSSLIPGHEAFLSLPFVSALRLGSLDNLESDIAWLSGYLNSRRFPKHFLARLLQAIEEAIPSHLEADSTMIVKWINDTRKNYTDQT